MRWLFLAILLLSLPLLVSYAGRGEQQRDRLLIALGALLFASGSIALDAALITWPVWPGTSRGIILSFVDVIALALLITRRGRAKTPPFLFLCGLLFIPMFVASFIATIPLASVFSLLQFVQIVFLFIVLSHELSRVSAIRSILKGIAIGLIVQAGYVVQQKLTGVVQASGTMAHQNLLGLVVQLSALPLIAAIMEGERSKIVYLGALAGAICAAGGGSRATMAFFALGGVLLIILSIARRSTPRKWQMFGIGLLAAAAIVPLAMGTLKARFGDNEIGTEDESRAAFERAAIAMAADHPLGVGPNNFVTINNTKGYARQGGIEWGGGLLDKPVHNAYLLARSEFGWVGEIALILLLGGVATRAFITGFSNRNADIVGLSLGSATAITMIAIHSNWEFAWFNLEAQRLFFVNAALVAGCVTIAARDSQERRRRLQNSKEHMGIAAAGPVRTDALHPSPPDYRDRTAASGS